MAQSDRGVARIEQKLKAALEASSFYEAHQMYRTLYYRYIRQQKYAEILETLTEGATILLGKDQQGSGADLALLLVDVLVKSSTKPSQEWIDRLSKLFVMMNPNIPERDAFITNSIKWSLDNERKGHPVLHKRYAEQFLKERKYKQAKCHYLYGGDGVAFGDVLHEMHQQGLEEYKDANLTILNATLRLLCLKNPEMASVTFKTFMSKCEDKKDDIVILDDVWNLIKCVESKDMEQFKLLSKRLELVNRSCQQYLEKIGKIYFNMEPPVDKRRQNIFSGLFNSMIVDDSSGDEMDCSPSPDTVKTTDYDLD